MSELVRKDLIAKLSDSDLLWKHGLWSLSRSESAYRDALIEEIKKRGLKLEF